MRTVARLSLLLACAGCHMSDPSDRLGASHPINDAMLDDCAANEIMLVETGECIPAVEQFVALPTVGATRPGLDDLRGGKSPTLGLESGSNSFAMTCMDHNEVGAGVTYKTGHFVVAGATAAIQTWVTLHQGNVGVPYGDPACALFEVATNRTELGIEVVIAYGADNEPSLQFFDWSCSSAYPCGALSSPDWVYVEVLTNLSSCYKSSFTDAGGHSRTRLLYNNETVKGKAAFGFPQAWTNRVSIYNSCLVRWDIFYTHFYRDNQVDCSVAGTNCGWMGPVLETNNASQPAIKESGFSGSALLDHGTWYSLTSTHTDWNTPYSPWGEYHRTANTEWGVGNSTAE